MKKIFPAFIYGLISMFLFSCIDEPEPSYIDDEDKVEQYIADNNLNAVKSDFGIYYVELDGGLGITPNDSSVVDASFSLGLLDGKLVDTVSNFVFTPNITPNAEVNEFRTLGQLYGIMETNLQGKNFVIMPSKLAFGTSSGTIGNTFIEANSILTSVIQINAIRTKEEQKGYEDQMILDYLEENNLEAELISEEGLYKVLLEEADTTAKPINGLNITVAYEGIVLQTGEKFDESESAVFTFSDESLIKGFYDGIATMKKGEKAIFIMPSHLAYGATGPSQGSTIYPYSALIFRVTLLDV
ncbi:FKBP-type peptidyl-prolyl cis-trans isomerase [Flexithrix dorotheae]|uniref:FKBP-type peptidyl-prolyl cis-trans isomerase n=1 Tax=Flexithrix dorotheae TaxID=70993 RepID=UPI00039CB71C|nr:FKBP-type peptidyl-prolyl cis-trans isomerase [Flexithrix dorotheae]